MWYSLAPVSRLFVLLLVAFSVRTVYVVSFTLVRLASVRAITDKGLFLTSMARLNRRAAGLRQATTAMFYLFGLIYFLQLQDAFFTPESNARPVGSFELENFGLDFHFAAMIFVVFFVLHTLQWFAHSRISSATSRIKPAPADT